MKLPFLEDSKWPTSREPEERVVNPSYERQLEDHLLDELMVALEKKDAHEFKEAMLALIQCIREEFYATNEG